MGSGSMHHEKSQLSMTLLHASMGFVLVHDCWVGSVSAPVNKWCFWLGLLGSCLVVVDAMMLPLG